MRIERPSMTDQKSRSGYCDELLHYCGFRPANFIQLPRCIELEKLLEALADAKDAQLRLHKRYVDLKYPASALPQPPSQPEK
jgi:hypothetical protein